MNESPARGGELPHLEACRSGYPQQARGYVLISDSASQWGALRSRLKQLSLLLAKPQPSTPGSQQARIIHSIRGLAAKAEISLGGLTVGTQLKGQKVLCDLKDPGWTRAVLVARALADRTGAVADEAGDHLRKENQASFRRWVLEGLEQPGASRAHRFISDNDQPVRHTEQCEPEDEDLQRGHQAMETRVAFWNQYWKGQVRVPDWPHWLEELRLEAKTQAADEGSDPIKFEQALAVIQKALAKAGLGLDSWRPRDWENLPKELLEELTEIL